MTGKSYDIELWERQVVALEKIISALKDIDLTLDAIADALRGGMRNDRINENK